MIKETTGAEELISSIQNTFSDLLSALEQFDDVAINNIPYEGSWTASQVADHITKSNRSIAKALLLKGTKINREVDERIPELKAVFLNFNSKLKSPDFILPDEETFIKETVIANLAHSIGKINERAEKEDLYEMINHPIFGDITKFEILHFVVYHTQRHLHQLKKISEAIIKI